MSESSITKFSNDIIKRSVEDLEKLFLSPIFVSRKPKILTIANADFSSYLMSILKNLDYEIKNVEFNGQSDVIFFELSSCEYEILILTNILNQYQTIPITSEIKKRFPEIRIIVISDDDQQENIKELYQAQIEKYVKIPINTNNLIQVINKQHHSEIPLIKFPEKSPKKGANPFVRLDPNGKITITGNSIPIKAIDVYPPIIKWVEQYVNDPAEVTVVDIQLKNINGASKKYLVILLRQVTYVSFKNKKFLINWYYENNDKDILQIGEEFSAVLDIPFNFISIVE